MQSPKITPISDIQCLRKFCHQLLRLYKRQDSEEQNNPVTQLTCILSPFKLTTLWQDTVFHMYIYQYISTSTTPFRAKGTSSLTFGCAEKYPHNMQSWTVTMVTKTFCDGIIQLIQLNTTKFRFWATCTDLEQIETFKKGGNTKGLLYLSLNHHINIRHGVRLPRHSVR